VASSDDPSVTIEWTAPESDGGSSILSYSIYVDEVQAGNVPASQLFYTEQDRLTLGATSLFKVSAINIIGEGSQSIGTAIIAAEAPYRPDMPLKNAAASNFIKVDWTPPSDGGSPIKGYSVYNNGVKVGDVAWNVYTFTVTTNLQAGNIYSISVSAYNDVGESVLSVGNRIMAAKVPSAPTSIRMIDQSSTFIEIAWERPDNGGTPLTTYTIYSD